MSTPSENMEAARDQLVCDLESTLRLVHDAPDEFNPLTRQWEFWAEKVALRVVAALDRYVDARIEAANEARKQQSNFKPRILGE